MQVTARATKWLGIEETGGIIEQNNYQNQKATAVFLPSLLPLLSLYSLLCSSQPSISSPSFM
jgi:hypothetical protein